MQVKVKRLAPEAQLPEYATDGAACFDIRALHGGAVPALGAHTFATGLAFEVPEGHAMLVFSRSGHGFKHGMRLANCVGVIDSDYRGEILVRLTNDKHVAYFFEAGDRIAQAMVLPVPRVEFEEVTELSETVRGTAGGGSTGNA